MPTSVQRLYVPDLCYDISYEALRG